MKKIIVLILLAFGFVTASAQQLGLQMLVDSSKWIVKGTVIEVEKGGIRVNETILYNIKVRVEGKYKGELFLDTLNVQMGKAFCLPTGGYESTVSVEKGKSYIIFLKEYRGYHHSRVGNTHQIYGPLDAWLSFQPFSVCFESEVMHRVEE